MKRYGYDHESDGALIFEIGSEADSDRRGIAPGLIVGTSEWGFMSEDDGRRISAALTYFSETSTEEIERLANERFPVDRAEKT